MYISKLSVENLRNLEAVGIEPCDSLNYMWGGNGAGKTSVLESIFVLSRGRSFRTTQPSELAGTGGKSFRVYAETVEDVGKTHRIGLERSGTHWRGRIDGEDVKKLSSLTRQLPLVLMEPDSHLLVNGPPESRRKYLDWGMFHVEHGFLDTWRRFSKALKQRNAALRQNNARLLDSLDEVLAEYGSRLDVLRKRHAGMVAEKVGAIMERVSETVPDVELEYQQGWKAETYLESLKDRRKKDLERGITGSGPHRAELKLSCNGVPARAVLSRGEQKAFAAAMLLTQANLLVDGGQKPVLLLDDLISEFDTEHFNRVLRCSLDTACQIWVTGTEKPELDPLHRVFHVEQGRVRELV